MLVRIFSEDTFTQFGEFPWMLALLSGEAEDGGTRGTQFHCGASLIHPQVAVTAAHCVNRYLVHILPTLLSICLSVCCFSERKKRFSLLFSSFPISKHVVFMFICWCYWGQYLLNVIELFSGWYYWNENHKFSAGTETTRFGLLRHDAVSLF
jgi:hypothetical protein